MATLKIENVPHALYAALKARAESRHRSMGEEVIGILSDALARQPLSLLEFEGLGKELWSGVDAGRHVEEERTSWD